MASVGTVARDYRFGRFLLEPGRRRLTADGQTVPLGARAYDILELLIERRDRVVSRDDILSHVWGSTAVEGNTLAVQISTLRRALGEPQVIATVAGRGYRFVGTVLEEAPSSTEPAARQAARPAEAQAPQVMAAPPAPVPLRPRRLGWIATVLLASLALGALALRDRIWPVPVAPRLSIVVLPFRNLGSDAQQDYLADAISDDLTTDLSHIPGSVVIARASADTYKGRAVATDVIGRALNVRYVLEGSLRAEGDTLHINAQLIDAPTGAHLWANAFDVARDKLGSARAEIVQHIGSALNVTLVDVEGDRSFHERSGNPDALDWYLRARSKIDHSLTISDMVAAEGFLEKSLALDGESSDALAELGLVLLHKVTDFDDPQENADHKRAAEAIGKAIGLAPRNVAAIDAKGLLELVDGRCEQAEPSFRLALLIKPNDLQAHSGLAQCAQMLGDVPEVLSEQQRILTLDPLGPRSAARENLIGMGYLLLQKPTEALVWLNRAGAGIASGGPPKASLSWQDWHQIFMIAATELSGDHAKARRLYTDYNAQQPHRTAWRLSTYGTKAMAALPGRAAYLRALQHAGMPQFADEHQDFGVSAPVDAALTNDFDPTPLRIPGARLADTDLVQRMLSSGHPPLLVDVGHGSAVIKGAAWLWSQGLWGDQDKLLSDLVLHDPSLHDRAVVVMGDGPMGWASYEAARQLVAKSCHDVFWYRGGEEAWVAAGYPAEDRRSP
jgi:TolB-like protein/DNA-binding winged helix-turn-helix (wHTH) protein